MQVQGWVTGKPGRAQTAMAATGYPFPLQQITGWSVTSSRLPPYLLPAPPAMLPPSLVGYSTELRVEIRSIGGATRPHDSAWPLLVVNDLVLRSRSTARTEARLARMVGDGDPHDGDVVVVVALEQHVAEPC